VKKQKGWFFMKIRIPVRIVNVSLEEVLEDIGPDKNIKELDAFFAQDNPVMLSTHDPYAFCDFMAIRRNGDYGEVLFGQAEFARSLVRDCYVGILNNPKKPAAALIGRDGVYSLCIYTPKEGV
jgi:hypothetical protein